MDPDLRAEAVIGQLLAAIREIPEKEMPEIASKMLGVLEEEVIRVMGQTNNGVVAGTVIYFSTAVLSYVINDLPPDARKIFEEGFTKLFQVGIAIKISASEEKEEEEQPSTSSAWEALLKRGKK